MPQDRVGEIGPFKIRLAKVTDATGTREFAHDFRSQVTKEKVTLLTGGDNPPILYEIPCTYTALGQPETVHLTSAGRDASTKRPPARRALDHRIEYTLNQHNQLATVKSLAGEFVYGYDANNPMLLTKMTGPVNEVETTYEPHRNLITGVTNKSLTEHAERVAGAQQRQRHEGTKGGVVSSYTYSNDVLGRRESISQGGEAFGMLKLGENKIDVAYNDRSEVTGAVYRSVSRSGQGSHYEGTGRFEFEAAHGRNRQ